METQGQSDEEKRKNALLNRLAARGGSEVVVDLSNDWINTRCPKRIRELGGAKAKEAEVKHEDESKKRKEPEEKQEESSGLLRQEKRGRYRPRKNWRKVNYKEYFVDNKEKKIVCIEILDND